LQAESTESCRARGFVHLLIPSSLPAYGTTIVDAGPATRSASLSGLRTRRVPAPFDLLLGEMLRGCNAVLTAISQPGCNSLPHGTRLNEWERPHDVMQIDATGVIHRADNRHGSSSLGTTGIRPAAQCIGLANEKGARE
jgi:hypothetical protein